MINSKTTDWRELCAAAAREEDAEKLTRLVNQIIESFDQSLSRRNSRGVPLSESADLAWDSGIR